MPVSNSPPREHVEQRRLAARTVASVPGGMASAHSRITCINGIRLALRLVLMEENSQQDELALDRLGTPNSTRHCCECVEIGNTKVFGSCD